MLTKNNNNIHQAFCRLAAVFLILLSMASCSDDEGGRIVIGRGFEISVLNELQYQTPFVVQVTEVDGSPATGSTVTITIDEVGYYKGRYVAADINQPPDGEADRWLVFLSTSMCSNEDANGNGILDAAEDTNGNGILDPANAATISPHATSTPTVSPGSNQLVTDSSGFGYFSLTYPKSQANWVEMAITARVADGSPGNTQTESFTLPVILDDLDDTNVSPPGGTEGAYGDAASCTDPD